MTLVLIGSGTNPIDVTGTGSQTLYNGILAINRLLFTICLKLPVQFYGTISTIEVCIDVVLLTYMGSGSLVINTIIEGGSYATPD